MLSLHSAHYSSFLLYNIPNEKTVVTCSQLDLTSLPRLRPHSPGMSDTGGILGWFWCQEAETSETLIWVSVPLSEPPERTRARARTNNCDPVHRVCFGMEGMLQQQDGDARLCFD